MNVKIYNQEAKEVGKAELPDGVFDLKWNPDLVHQVVTSYAANRRRGTAHVKGRGEVRGGGKKPWRQKGTGRARHGSIRSPLWRGGGVTHGPIKEKVYVKKIPKKMARKALYTVLSAKARDNEIIVLDDLKFTEPKTRLAARIFENLSKVKEFQTLGKAVSRGKRGRGVLVTLGGKDENARRALRNLPYVGIEEARNLNAYELLQYKYVMFPKHALEVFK